MQSPQAEGELDQVILGGALLSKPEYINVISWTNDSIVTVNGGRLTALYSGSVVSFYPP